MVLLPKNHVFSITVFSNIMLGFHEKFYHCVTRNIFKRIQWSIARARKKGSKVSLRLSFTIYEKSLIIELKKRN